MPAMTTREYAEHRGCTRQAVEKAIKAGRLKASITQRKPQVLIDCYHADQEWARRTRRVRQPDDAGAEQQAAALADGLDATGRPPPATRAAPAAGDARDVLDTEKARKAAIDRELAELNLQKAKGQVVPVDAARNLWFEKVRALRDRLLVIPTQLSGELASHTDPDYIAGRIDESIRAALTGLPDLAPMAEATKQ